MSATDTTIEAATSDGIQGAPNGCIAAAILGCGIGSCLLGILAVAADGSKTLARWLTFYRPTGPLSGVTTVAIVFWLIVWLTLAIRWRRRTVAISKVNAAAFVLFALAMLLTFPPIGDFIIRK